MKRIITAVCLVLGLAGCVWAQGLSYPLIDWRFINGGSLPQTYAVFMKEDRITIKVEPGDSMSLGPDDMVIVLTSNVGWKKEVTAFSFCNGRGQTIWTHDSNRGPHSMRLHRSNCTNGDTVVLRKENSAGNGRHVSLRRISPLKLWAGKSSRSTGPQILIPHSYPSVCNFPCGSHTYESRRGNPVIDTDGKADLAVYRSANLFVTNSSNGANLAKPLGTYSDRPVPYDYDGDGRTDTAVWRSNTGDWIIITSLTGQQGW
jgi:hypothetical protein